MTAVSLLFSIYQVKPSPFCVLDELDAPLDESNINRFIRCCSASSTHSQFIIITHNKRTIGMADVLYGVTMEEHGVSKIVSVKFHKAGEPANVTTTTTAHEHDLTPLPAGPTVEEMRRMRRTPGKKHSRSHRNNFLSAWFVWGNTRATSGCTGELVEKRRCFSRRFSLLASVDKGR